MPPETPEERRARHLNDDVDRLERFWKGEQARADALERELAEARAEADRLRAFVRDFQRWQTTADADLNRLANQAWFLVPPEAPDAA